MVDWSLSFTLIFRPLLFFAVDVALCFVYAVIITKTAVLKTNKNQTVNVKQVSLICPFLEV